VIIARGTISYADCIWRWSARREQTEVVYQSRHTIGGIGTYGNSGLGGRTDAAWAGTDADSL